MKSVNETTIIIGANVNGAVSGFRRVEHGLGRLRGQIQRFSGFTGIFSALGVAVLANELVSAVDRMTELNARLRLVNGSMQEVYEVSQRTRTSIEATATLYTRLALATQNTAITQQQLLDVTQAINEAMYLSGATTKEAMYAIIQLSQAFARGVLRGDEFRSIAEQTPELLRAIGRASGKTMGELIKMAEQGQLTTEFIIQNILKEKEVIDQQFSEMPMTIAQAWTQLENSFMALVGWLNEATGAAQLLSGAMSKTAQAFGSAKSKMQALLATDVGNFLSRWGEDFVSLAKFIGKALWEGIKTAIQQVWIGLKNLGKGFVQLGEMIWAAMTLDTDKVKQHWNSLLAIPSEMGKEAQKSFDDLVTNLKKDLADLQKDWAHLPGLVGPDQAALKRQREVLRTKKQVTDAIKETTKATKDESKAIREAEAAQKRLKAIQEQLFSDDQAGKIEKIRFHFQRLREEITELAFKADADLGQFMQLMDMLDAKEAEQIKRVVEGVKKQTAAHKEAASKVSEAWINAYNNITNALADALSRGGNLIKSFVSWVKDALAQLFARQIVGSIAVGLGLPGAAAWAGQAGGIGNVAGGISNIGGAISAAGGLWNWINGGISGVGNTLMYGVPEKLLDWGFTNAAFTLGSLPPELMGGLTAGLGTFLLQGLLGGDWAKAAVSGASTGIGAGIGSIIAPGIGTAIGAIAGGLLGNIAGGLFGDGTERTYLRRAYTFGYDKDLGASYTYKTTRWDRGEPDWMDELVKAEKGLADSMTEILNNVVSTLDKFAPGFSEKIAGKTFSYETYWGVETEKEFKKRTEQNVVGFAKNVLGPVIDEFKTDFKASLSGLDLSLFTDDFKNQVQEGYEKAFSQIDFSKIKTVDDLKKQFDNLNKVLESEKRLEEFVAKVKELDRNFKRAVGDLDEYHARLEDINDAWLKQKEALEAMGVDLEKMPEFFGAWGKAIEELKMQIFGFVLDVPEKFDEAWAKIIHDISQLDLGGKMVELLNQALEDPSKMATVGQEWAQWLGDAMKSSVLSGAMDSLMDQVKQAYIQPIMQSMLGTGFGAEGIMSIFTQIDEAIPKLAEAGQSMADVFGYIQQTGSLQGFDWENWKEKYGDVWAEINAKNQEAAAKMSSAADAHQAAARAEAAAAKAQESAAQALNASAGALTAAAGRIQAPPPVYVTVNASGGIEEASLV